MRLELEFLRLLICLATCISQPKSFLYKYIKCSFSLLQNKCVVRGINSTTFIMECVDLLIIVMGILLLLPRWRMLYIACCPVYMKSIYTQSINLYYLICNYSGSSCSAPRYADITLSNIAIMRRICQVSQQFQRRVWCIGEYHTKWEIF